MRVVSLKLKDFKRFSNLEIDLSGHPSKIVAIVGPNGSGKSSVFDAFEDYITQQVKGGRTGKSNEYFQKSAFDPAQAGSPTYAYNNNIELKTDQAALQATSVYIRSAYRFTPRLNAETIQRLTEVERDANRPQMMMDQDNRLKDNYERLIGRFFNDVYDKDLSGEAWAKQNIEGLNKVLANILDIKVTYLGNPVDGEGSLYFEKGSSKRFPYEILSAGEKEVVDIVLDLYVKRGVYKNSIICIDEPELHLNTAIQRKMLVEIEKLISDQSQLWVATHSIGFLRALQEDLRDKTAVLDFTDKNFDSGVTLKPVPGTRDDWMRIFATALEDLTGLLAPKQIVYCEGRPDPTPTGQEQGLDADIYNLIFAEKHRDTLFVSSGGGDDVKKNALIALRVLKKALSQVSFLLLKDRDGKSDADRLAFLAADSSRRMLIRHEIENYLFDKEPLKAYCQSENIAFDEARYDAAVTNIITQDLKAVQEEIKKSCSFSGKKDALLRKVASVVTSDMAVFSALESEIF